MKAGIICIEIGLFSGLSWIEPVRGPTWSISILLDQQGDDHKLPPQSGRWCLSLVTSDPSAALECVVTSSHLARITFLWSYRCLKCNSFSQFHDQLIPLPWQEVNCLRHQDSPVSLGYLVVSFWSYIIADQPARQTEWCLACRCVPPAARETSRLAIMGPELCPSSYLTLPSYTATSPASSVGSWPETLRPLIFLSTPTSSFIGAWMSNL